MVWPWLRAPELSYNVLVFCGFTTELATQAWVVLQGFSFG
jgi:hypothetical protein